MTSAKPERPVGELLGDLARLYLGAWAASGAAGLDDGILPVLGSRYGAYELYEGGFAA